MQNNHGDKRSRLNNGTYMPTLGVGCWMGTAGDGDHVTSMVKTALDLGYRHIDTAANYGNEASVGKALQKTNIPRSDIWLTTKLDQKDHGRVEEALDVSLTKLGVDYVDLYLMHWPMAYNESGRTLQPHEKPTFVDTWKDMEKLLVDGKTKAIGVSNFSIKTLTELLAHATVVPAVNQVEVHPMLPQHALLDFCTKHKIVLTAYSPLGKYKFADDPVILKIADDHGITSAQLLLSWGIQRGTAVIPKTANPERLKDNLRIVPLNMAEASALDDFHTKPGMHRSVCGFHTAELGGSCWGWTYEQLGWRMTTGGVHLGM